MAGTVNGQVAPTRADGLVSALVERIVSGRAAPGLRLDEQALAGEFGMSRTPVREALRRLAATGLVEVRARRGAVVASPDAASMAEWFETLAELEAACARWAARRMTPRERAGLEAHHRTMGALVRGGDRGGYGVANLAFHALLCGGAHNSSLLELVEGMNRRLTPFRGAQFESPERLALSFAEHEAVVVAVVRGNGDGASDAMRGHILNSGRSWRDLADRLSRPESRAA